MKIPVHLILVSAQAVPNITPVLDEDFRPDTVILLVSPDMQTRADWLEAVIKRRGIATRRWPIDDPWDIEHIQSRVIDLLDAQAQQPIALNATGGTKPMSIAAYEIFREFEKPIFYVHPEQDRIVWMYPPKQPGQALADRIKLPEFFQAYGATVTGQGDKLGVPPIYRTLTEDIIGHIGPYEKALATLNFRAARAERSLAADLNDDEMRNGALRQLIDRFESAGVLALEKNRLTFPSEDARFFVNGGWLEQHVYGLCLNLKKAAGIQDIGRSIEVERLHRNQPVKNEIDVALLKDNRLYLIECKTKVFNGNHAVHSEGAQTLYKLDTLKDLLGGLQARAMLISFTQPRKHDLQRAGDLGIAVCSYRELMNLKEKLRVWMQ
ncbi:Card1-like endonuclease domain-containing protein [Methylomicrobium lacus]|uniref:Card1-like endonuclease domain-containing protein n=1 Tax=Methylomicrobium lacus TaxID=136992 RepID=UPI0035A97A71